VDLRVLGKSPAWPDAGGACSGYLVSADGTCLLLDCGCGVFGKLRAVIDYAAVDAVVISHLHADHILDLVPYASGLRYGPRRDPPRPRLIAPPGARDAFRRLCAAGGMQDEHIELAFALEEYDPDGAIEIGGVRVRFQPVPHFLSSNAVEIVGDGSRITYSGDSAPSEDLCTFAAGTDLLLIEATVPEPERDGPRGHLTPAEAGDHGRRAGARRLVLTHLTDELDAEWARGAAEKAFGGPVEVAREGAVYRLDG
jgi:ribonuclease BN (tRNA processing enzyme)